MKDAEIKNPWDGKEGGSPLKSLSVEGLVLRWINFQIKDSEKCIKMVSMHDNYDHKRVTIFVWMMEKYIGGY